MRRDKFKQLYDRALDRTLRTAQKQIGRELPHRVEIVFQGGTVPGVLMDVEKSFEEIWLGEDEFYRIVDLLVIGYSPDWTRVMVTISGHRPSSFWDTWDKEDLGPFKAQGAERKLWKSKS